MRLTTLLGILVMVAGLLSGVPAGAEISGQQRAQAAGRLILGTPAPRLILKTIDGDTIDLGALYGKKAVYLKFWATWCVPCRQQMPHFEHAYENAGPDMAVIAIDVGFNDSVEAIRDYRKKLGITMPIVFDDGHLGLAFHVRVTPTHIVIGRDGRIAYVGHLADHELDAALVAARAGSPAEGMAAGTPAPAGAPERAIRRQSAWATDYRPGLCGPSTVSGSIWPGGFAGRIDRSRIPIALVRILSGDDAARKCPRAVAAPGSKSAR